MKPSQVSHNELIKERRKKLLRRRILLLTVFMISVLVVLALKLPYFGVKNITVNGNKRVNSDEIVKLSDLYKGNNIFYVNLSAGKTKILSNPYLLEVSIKRKLPSTLQISVMEREAVFYGKRDNKFLIVDKNGVLLEERDDINSMNLIELSGLNFKDAKIGNVVPSDDKRKIDIISNITDLVVDNKSDIKISFVDITNILDLKVKCNNMDVKLGTSDGLKDKLNKAINILSNNDLKSAKGYIDVSFDGNPVVFTEK